VLAALQQQHRITLKLIICLCFLSAGMGIDNNNGGYGGDNKLGGSRYVPPHLRNSNTNSFSRSSDSWDDASRNNRSNDRYSIYFLGQSVSLDRDRLDLCSALYPQPCILLRQIMAQFVSHHLMNTWTLISTVPQ
jgi:hypothetical protein